MTGSRRGRKNLPTSKEAKISQLQFHTILNNIPDQAWLKDATGRYLAVNQTYIAACGHSEEEIIGHKAAEVWPEEIANQYTRTDRRVLISGRQWHFEEKRMNRAGKLMIFETIKTPVHDEDGLIIGTTGISRDITRYKTIQTQLLRQRERSHKLWIQLQSVQDEERARISRELHDELSQNLSALGLGLDWLETKLLPGQELLNKKIHSLREALNSTMHQMTKIALELKPAVLIDLGLRAAIQHVVRITIERSSRELDVRLEFNADEGSINSEAKLAIFRVFQEALTNVVRHAEATSVLIKIYESRRKIVLMVKDNGCGMGVKVPPECRIGLGILGMEERAKLLGGQLTLISKIGRGTNLALTIPKQRLTSHAG